MARGAERRRIAAYGCLMLVWLLAGAARADYVVQVGVYEKPRYAGQIARSLHLAGLPVRAQAIINVPDGLMIRLMVGPYPNRRAAEDALARVKTLGQTGFVRRYVEGPEVKRPAPPAPAPAAPPPPPVKEAPLTLEQLELEPPPPPALDEELLQQALAAPAAGGSVSAEDLFGLADLGAPRTPRLSGFYQGTLAYAWPEPAHLSKFRHILELATERRWGDSVKVKLSGRLDYDAVFDLTDHYPAAVADDQRLEASLRETYVDIAMGAWDFRIGYQHVIWSEMVGLFFADVVSAKDLRDFVLPEFDILRIPQWALRGEYFKGDFHAEAVWIPYPSYNDIGVPGAEFYTYPPPPPPGYGFVIADERKPAGELAHSNYGLRLSYLTAGWDLSAFYYSSMDATATFFREVISVPVPAYVYTPDHTRIEQVGGTLSKDFTDKVLKAEMIATRGRWFAVDSPSGPGVVQHDSLDYVVGLEYNLPRSSRFTLQLFQRWLPDPDPDLLFDEFETGASFSISTSLHDGRLEPQLLVGGSLNRGDWLARPKLVWTLGGNWRWAFGADIFGGPRLGLFGQYDDKDRVYTELRYSF